MECQYGCGKEAKFQLKNGKWCCEARSQKCSEVRRKNSESSKSSHNSGVRNYSHLKGRNPWNKGLTKDFFPLLLIERGNKCEECGITDWNGKQIKLEKHHKNGNKLENTKENIIFLCPNCHSQTDNYCGRNMNRWNGTTGYKVSDIDLIEAIKTTKNIRRALIKVGLTPKGANYYRVQDLKVKYGI
jgi:hypothetical protein